MGGTQTHPRHSPTNAGIRVVTEAAVHGYNVSSTAVCSPGVVLLFLLSLDHWRVTVYQPLVVILVLSCVCRP